MKVVGMIVMSGMLLIPKLASAYDPEFVEIKFDGATSSSTSGSYEVTPGHEFWVSVTFKNTSATEYRGGITVSLPGFNGSVIEHSATYAGGGTEEYCIYVESGSYDRLYLNDGSYLNPSIDDFIESHDPSWTVNGQQTLSFKLKASSSPESFSLYVRGWLSDDSWAIKETNPHDGEFDQQVYNCFSYTIDVVPAGAPDLDVWSMWGIEKPWTWGDTVEADLWVDNLGSVTASGVDIVLLASNDKTTGDADDHVIQSWSDVTISGGGFWYRNDYTWDLPSSPYPNMPANGKVYYYLVVSPALGETELEDNEEYDGIMMSEPGASPGITLTSPSSDMELTENGSITIRWTGDDHDSSSDAAVALFRDDDQDFGNGGRTTIASSQDEDGTYQWSIGSLPEGTYYVGAIIDDGSETAHDYASGNVTVVADSGGSDSESSSPTTVDTRDLTIELTDIEMSPHFGSHQVDITFYGRVTTQSGQPAEDVAVGVHDPWKSVSTLADNLTDVDGEFSYSSSASGDSGNYLFVFLIGDQAQMTCPVAIKHDDEGEWVNLPDTSILLGAQSMYEVAGNTVSLSSLQDETIFDNFGEMLRDSAKTTGRVAARTTLDTLADRAGDPFQLIASAGVMACLAPEVTVTKVACAAGVTYTAGRTVSDGLKNFLLNVLNETELTQEKKALFRDAIEKGFYAASGVQLSGAAGILDIGSYAYESAQYLPGSYSWHMEDGSDQVEFVTETSSDNYGVFAVRVLLEEDHAIRVENPNDDTLRIQFGSAEGGSYDLYQRDLGATGWGNPVATVSLNAGEDYSYSNKNVMRGGVYEYTVMPAGMSQSGSIATGKVEHVVVLVRGLDLFDYEPDGEQSSYWVDLRSSLTNDGFVVWDACYDSAYGGELLAGQDNWGGEAVRLKSYLNDKLLTYDTLPYGPPTQLDLVAHSMGALTSRKAISDGMPVPVSKLITLSGTHHGSVYADYYDALPALLFPGIAGYHIDIVLDLLLSREAITSLKPDYVEGHWPALPSNVDLYVAGGTTPDPGLSLTEALNKWGMTYDGIVSLHSTLAGAKQPVVRFGRAGEDDWVCGPLPRTAEKSFLLDHYDIKSNANSIAWVKNCLAGELAPPVGADSMMLSANAEVLGSSPAGKAILAWDRSEVFTATNQHVVVVDDVTSISCLFLAPTNLTCTLQAPDGGTFEIAPSVTVSNPVTGSWTTTVYAASSPTDTGNYSVVVFAETDALLDYAIPDGQAYQGSTVSFLANGSNSLFDVATITGTVHIASGDTCITNLSLASSSNGAAAAWGPLPTTGYFDCRFDVSGKRATGESFQRVHRFSMSVQPEFVRFDGEPVIRISNPNRDSHIESVDVLCPLLALTNLSIRIHADVYAGSNRLCLAESAATVLTPYQAENVILSIPSEHLEMSSDSALSIGPFMVVGEDLDGLIVANHPSVTSVVLQASSLGVIDSDGDGVPDQEEAERGLLPDNPDSDGDGLSDGDELNIYGTQPTHADTDGDGMSDGDELVAGTGALDRNDLLEITDVNGVPTAAIRVEWSAISGKTYNVEWVGALGMSWSNAPSGIGQNEQSHQTAISNGPLLYLDVVPIGDTNRFYRITVEDE